MNGQIGKIARLATSASALAFFIAAPAYAQDATQAAEEDNQGGIGEIIVTANKRSENLQKTPAAITAISGSEMVDRGITTITAAQEVVPNARFQQQGNTVQVYLRGVGSSLDFANQTPPVAMNFNGIYVPREGTSVGMFDFDRFEVLPGPQGTLYGRGVIGGVINVSFKRPEFENGGRIDIEAGNYYLAHGTAVLNLAASDSLAFRAAVDYNYREGYMTSGADSKDDFSARLSTLYKPNEAFTAYVWGYYSKKSGSPANIVNKGTRASYNAAGQVNGLAYDEPAFLTSNPWNDQYPSLDPAFAALIGSPSLAPFGQPTKPTQDYEHWAIGAEFNLKLGDNLTLTYIPGFVQLDATSNVYWLGNVPAFKDDHYRSMTHEVRLAGDNGPLNWLLGVYAYRRIQFGKDVVGSASGEFGPQIPTTPFPFYASHVLRNRLEGIAAFGQATFEISPGFKVTAGARYGTDSTKANGIALDDQLSHPLHSPYLEGTPYTYDRSINRFDFKVAAQYDLTPDVMIYAQYQTGYQPNTFNEVVDLPGRSNHVKPATLKAIAGGFKARFFNDTLQINDEVFFSDYRNYQIQFYDATKLYNPIINAGKVTIPGNQLDIVWKPTPDDRINLSVGYIHARNKDFVVAGGGNYNGLALNYAADWTISGGVSHDFQLKHGYVRAAVDGRYESRWWADFAHGPGTMQGNNFKFNAALTYYSEDGNWNVGIWGRNLGNKAVLAAAAAAGVPGPAVGYLEAPRTYGIRAGVSF